MLKTQKTAITASTKTFRVGFLSFFPKWKYFSILKWSKMYFVYYFRQECITQHNYDVYLLIKFRKVGPGGGDKQANEGPDMFLWRTVYFGSWSSPALIQTSLAEPSALFTPERNLGQPQVNTLFTRAECTQTTRWVCLRLRLWKDPAVAARLFGAFRSQRASFKSRICAAKGAASAPLCRNCESNYVGFFKIICLIICKQAINNQKIESADGARLPGDTWLESPPPRRAETDCGVSLNCAKKAGQEQRKALSSVLRSSFNKETLSSSDQTLRPPLLTS